MAVTGPSGCNVRATAYGRGSVGSVLTRGRLRLTASPPLDPRRLRLDAGAAATAVASVAVANADVAGATASVAATVANEHLQMAHDMPPR